MADDAAPIVFALSCLTAILVPWTLLKLKRLARKSVAEADAWLAGMMYDSTRGKSCLGIFDAAALEDGPVCRLWLKTPVPHGLHGCFSPELAHEF